MMLYRLKSNRNCQIELTEVATIKSVDPIKWNLITVGEQFPVSSVNLNIFEPMYFETYLNELQCE